ncbi:hypothetical protein Dda_6577 [Drechslerella dactyloides]|uniref:Leucine rich repeat protein n=1 Tax=Drechslerella dactyloides TaxID=74499 RepID=A0AAD6NJ20_DREDA|nr:hypothetical protein Dda_6577 [Drechslerella dactyloides]
MAAAVELHLDLDKDLDMLPKGLNIAGPVCTSKKDRTTAASWVAKLKAYGRWDQAITPDTVLQPPGLPMPVDVAPYPELEPFFRHLADDSSAAAFSAHFDDSHDVIPNADDEDEYSPGHEPYYRTEFLEFPRGVVYADRRMDLCKMVVGPTSIGRLMESLESNTFIRHFLLGNNIIGPTGADAIADFLAKRPAAMRTWYLAGNCIDGPSLTLLADAMIHSPVIENLWLKRNPLGPDADKALFKLLSQLPRLRTLDLDQTDLGDACLARLFANLCDHFSDFLPIAPPSPLNSLYLNGAGVLPAATPPSTSPSAIHYISLFLSQQTCQLTSLYISNNLLGDAGLTTLASGLRKNTSLERLSLQSVGGGSEGFSALFTALTSHRAIRMLDAGQSYATIDLKMQFNALDDEAVPAIESLITSSQTLSYLDLGHTYISQSGLNTLSRAVANSDTLLFYNARSLLTPDNRSRDARSIHAETNRLKTAVKEKLEANILRDYGISYDEWFNNERRWLVNDRRDVRAIDSVYRNRDAGMARRGQMVLKKWWTAENEGVLRAASGRSCALPVRTEAEAPATVEAT